MPLWEKENYNRDTSYGEIQGMKWGLRVEEWRERETERKGEIERGSKNDVQLMHKLK